MTQTRRWREAGQQHDHCKCSVHAIRLKEAWKAAHTPFCWPTHCMMSFGFLCPVNSSSFDSESKLNAAGKPYLRVGYRPILNLLHRGCCSSMIFSAHSCNTFLPAKVVVEVQHRAKVMKLSQIAGRMTSHLCCAVNSCNSNTGLYPWLCIEVLCNLLIFRLKVLTSGAPIGIKFHKHAIAGVLAVEEGREICF